MICSELVRKYQGHMYLGTVKFLFLHPVQSKFLLYIGTIILKYNSVKIVDYTSRHVSGPTLFLFYVLCKG